MLEITLLSQKVNTCLALTVNKTGAVLEFEGNNLFLALLHSQPQHVRTLSFFTSNIL